MEQMHEISFSLNDADGAIRLEQPNGFDEPDVVLLHPEQLAFISRRMVGMTEATAAQVADLERKLAVLAGDLENIVTDNDIRRQIIECPDGPEIITRLDGLLDLATEFDGGRLKPRCATSAHDAALLDAKGQHDAETQTSAGDALRPADADQ